MLWPLRVPTRDDYRFSFSLSFPSPLGHPRGGAREKFIIESKLEVIQAKFLELSRLHVLFLSSSVMLGSKKEKQPPKLRRRQQQQHNAGQKSTARRYLFLITPFPTRSFCSVRAPFLIVCGLWQSRGHRGWWECGTENVEWYVVYCLTKYRAVLFPHCTPHDDVVLC